MSDHYPIISVVMPAYNAAKFISQTIESVLAQTFTDFELLILDDGSTDHTLEIAKDYKLSDRRFLNP
jgi:glycosyltransferase involved in cell wall biosynthesis